VRCWMSFPCDKGSRACKRSFWHVAFWLVRCVFAALRGSVCTITEGALVDRSLLHFELHFWRA